MNDIIEGLHDAVAFTRIQKLIDKERRRIKRSSELHPGSQSFTGSERLNVLLEVQALFASSSVVQVKQK